MIGGNIDFRFFLGDSNPETAVKMYHRYVNGYTLHPFWAQGENSIVTIKNKQNGSNIFGSFFVGFH